MQEDFGVRRQTPDKKRWTDEAALVHRLHRRWSASQSNRRVYNFVMPICSLYLRLALDNAELGRHESHRHAQRLLVDAINDPHGGLEVRLLPSRSYR
jgi:hypothetical protein